MTGEQLIEMIRRSSYIVSTAQGVWGSAIAIGPDVLATAKHVVTGQKILKAECEYTGVRLQVNNIILGSKDIAFLQTTSIPYYIPPSSKPWSEYSPDDLVYTWASASSIQELRPFLVTVGFLVGVADTPDTDFAVSLGSYYGCSGAGVVHQDGVVIGVLSRSYGPVLGLPRSDKSIVYATDIYPLAKEQSLIPQTSENTKPISFHWYSRELLAMLIGAAGGIILMTLSD